jgi:pimeloyl-ACP methyl ester carboxylesterase
MPTVHANGIDLAYDISGDGPALVLAHGYLATKAMWTAQAEALSQRYQLIVYDIRGHGSSGAPPVDDRGYSIDNLVADQKALMDHLGIEEAIIGGLSLGGMIAMRFALKHAGSARALLLCDTSAGMGLEGQFAANRFMLEALVRTQGVKTVLRAFYAQSPHRIGLASRNQLPVGVQAFIDGLEGMSPDGFLGVARAAGDAPSVLARLPEITCPTMILTGDNDFFRDASQDMHARLPTARFVTITNSAHGTCVWQPAAFTAAVLDFLNDVEAGTTISGERTY